MTIATSPGYLRYPLPTIYLADAHSNYQSNSANEPPIMSIPFFLWPSMSVGDGTLPTQLSGVEMSSNALQQRVDTSASVRLLTYSTPSGQYELVCSPMESNEASVPNEQLNNSTREMGSGETNSDGQAEVRGNQIFPIGDPGYWKLPFLQGWLIGQSQASQHAMHSQVGGPNGGFPSYSVVRNPSVVVPPVIPTNVGNTRVHGRSGSRHQSSHTITTVPTAGSGDATVFNSIRPQHRSSQPFVSQIQSEVATSLAETAAAELPCTVKLRIWSLDVQNPCSTLDTERCRLTIPHAVLCRYITLFASF